MIIRLDNTVLFPTLVYKYHIDPTSYDKDSIVKTVINNYNKSPNRNRWDVQSTLHHYYNDWENEEFDHVNLSSVMTCYENVVQDFVSSFNFKNRFSWNYFIQNITVYKEANHFMDEHDHYGDDMMFSAVHYIQKKETDSGLTFVNPLTVAQYPAIKIRKWAVNNLEHTDINNSAFFKDWTMQPKQDEFVIFPSFLKHKVLPSRIEDNDFRIAISLNIKLSS